MDRETSAAGVVQLVEQVAPQMIAWRRHLHAHPELSFEEHETQRYIAGVLSRLPGLMVTYPTPTSVMATLAGGGDDGPCIALRADIDGLPIHEENEFDFRSLNEGVMHACGHDGHVAMSMGAAVVLARLSAHFHGEVRFLFQHAEEQPPGGSRDMIQAGVLEGVSQVIGCHLLSTMPVGQIAVLTGACTAAADTFAVRITGAGGHAAFPHLSVDPIAVGAQVVSNLQHVVSRRTSAMASVVVSVTQFHGGTADNVIPDAVHLSGTVRSFNHEARERTKAAMEQTIAGIAGAHGARSELDYVYGYDPVVNDAAAADIVRSCIRHVTGVKLADVDPLPAGDDMTYFLQEVPGAYFFVGTRSSEANSTFPHHHPRFTIDERSLPHGAETLARAALTALARSG
jgi:amidohydrolase